MKKSIRAILNEVVLMLKKPKSVISQAYTIYKKIFGLLTTMSIRIFSHYQKNIIPKMYMDDIWQKNALFSPSPSTMFISCTHVNGEMFISMYNGQKSITVWKIHFNYGSPCKVLLSQNLK